MDDEQTTEEQTVPATAGMYLTRDVERRAHALQLAHDSNAAPTLVVERAEQYLGFLNGGSANAD